MTPLDALNSPEIAQKKDINILFIIDHLKIYFTLSSALLPA